MTRETVRLLPLWVFMFILPFTHTVALRLLGLFAAFVIATVIWVRSREPRLPFALPAWPWIAFWALLPLLLLPFSRDIAFSAGEIKSEIAYGLTALLTTVVLLRSERDVRRSLMVVVAAFVVMTIWALGSQLVLGYWKEASRFGGVGSFSSWLATVMPLLLLVRRGGIFGMRSAAVAGLLLVLAIATGFLTGQRTFWVVLFAQTVALAAYARAAGWWRVSRAAAFGTLTLAALLTVSLMWVAVGARFGLGNGAELLAEDPRMQNWGRVLGWIAEQPWTGFGFGRGMMEHAFPEMWGRADMFWHAHNVVLNYGFQLGIAGFVAILGLFGALFVHWWRCARSGDAVLEAIGATGVLVVTGVFMRNMTNDFFQRDLSLLFWTITGILAAWAATRSRPPDAG